MAINQATATYSVSVVSRIFFDQEPWWLRYHEREGHTSRGTRINNRDKGGDRRYSIDDVRDIAVDLRKLGVIDDLGLENCLNRCNAIQNRRVFTRSKTK